MRSRRSRRRNKQRKILIISVCIILIFMTAGYAAMQTSLSIKAKGNVIRKEIDITDNIVNSGDGLYIDTYETDGTRYVYKGANPNNYIQFNDELWRIIAKEADGTYKIIKDEFLEERIWSSTNRCPSISRPEPATAQGCNRWNEPVELNTYLNGDYYNTFNSNINSQIVNHSFEIGSVANNNDLLSQINDEKSVLWEGNVGLITVGDYIMANSDMLNCGTININNTNNTSCSTTNWLFNSNDYWTISAWKNDTTFVYVYYIVNTGKIEYSGAAGTMFSSSQYGVRPVVFLSSDIKIISGTGSEQDPYIIE